MFFTVRQGILLSTYGESREVRYQPSRINGRSLCGWHQRSDGTFAIVTEPLNHIVRKIDLATRNVTLLAGQAGAIGSTDGVGSAALFHYPHGMALAPDGSFALISNSNSSQIRRITMATGDVTTVSTNGERIYNPSDIAISADQDFALFMDGDGIKRLDLASYRVDTLNSFFKAWYSGHLALSASSDLLLFAADYYTENGSYGAALHRMDFSSTLRDEWFPLTGSAPRSIAHALSNPALASDLRARGKLTLKATVYGPQITGAISSAQQILATQRADFLLQVGTPGGPLATQTLTLDGYRTSSVPLTLAPTATTLAITLTDSNGVADSMRLDLANNLPDSAAPTVALAQPNPATYPTATQAAVLVSGSASDESGVYEVLVNGRRAALDRATGAYSLTLYLAPGQHTVQALARDFVGNQAQSLQRTVEVTYREPLVALAQSMLTASENGGPITITVALNEPSALTGTVRIRSANGTALSGQDYGAIDQILTFAPYQITATAQLVLLDDQAAESSETLALQLDQPNRLILAPPTTLGVTIADDDGGAPPRRIYLPLVLNK